MSAVKAIAVKEGVQGVYAITFRMRDGTARQQALMPLAIRRLPSDRQLDDLDFCMP